MYTFLEIEKKWRKKWEEDGLYKTGNKTNVPKQYILDMYPYPSGVGLHVGHFKGYIGTDVYARYKRMNGFNVLHPMGWDAFGLPAENYAIKTSVHPKMTTDKAIRNFKRQIEGASLSYDWIREIGTHTPAYYKWTQWFFLLFYKNNLAYKKTAKVNWDPVDKTVLANEQVLSNGTAERSGSKVIQKDLKQWFFRITDFAEGLIKDLDNVDWPESTVLNQRNWIGKSKGSLIQFPISGLKGKVDIFTTRADTILGTTYLVLAPEHELIEQFKDKITNWKTVETYVKKSKNRTENERLSEGKTKTGIELKGIRVINPATQREIPIWIADYVLISYGTGAIMAVPDKDERDKEFAKKFKLPITKTKLVDKDKITKEVNGKIKTYYRLRDWLISRQRYWGVPIPIVYDPDGKPHPVPDKYLPWLLPTDVEFKPTGASPLGQSKELVKRTEKLFGKGWRPEIDTMDTFVCSSWYFFRFTDPHNNKEFASKRALKKWMPVDLYVGGAEHTVLHLMYARFFTKALKKLGYVSFDEPFLKLRHQGLIMGSDERKMGKRYGNIVTPEEVIKKFGADTFRVYEMFMTPFEGGGPWSSRGILGPYRFLNRVWELVENFGEKSELILATRRNEIIKKVTEDIERMDYNTAIAALMTYSHYLKQNPHSKKDLEVLLILLAPFAPHITEELWEKLGNKYSIHKESWLTYDKKRIVKDRINLIVQVNGKFRATIEVKKGITKKEAEKLALNEETVNRQVKGRLQKVIFVKNRLINFVVEL